MLTLRYIYIYHVTRGNAYVNIIFLYYIYAHGVVILTSQVMTTLAYVFHQE